MIKISVTEDKGYEKKMMIFVMTMLFGVVGAASGNTTVSAAETDTYYESRLDNGAVKVVEVADSAIAECSIPKYELTAKSAIKKSPSSSSKTIGYAYKGEIYVAISRSGNWIKVNYRDTYGYINKSHLKKL